MGTLDGHRWMAGATGTDPELGWSTCVFLVLCVSAQLLACFELTNRNRRLYEILITRTLSLSIVPLIVISI